jgi:hypothetical protein
VAGLGAALGVGASLASGFAGQSQYVDAYRNQRRRIGQTLKFGRSMFGTRADQAQQFYQQAIGRIQQGTAAALAETSRLGQTARFDLQASLEQQLARNRQGAGGLLAQSSLMPAFNRGVYSDFRRDLGALAESIAAKRANIHMAGASQEAGYTQVLADALFRRGSAEFDMQQALAGRFGNVAPPQGFDFGELGFMLDDLFGGKKATPGIPEGISL